MFQKFSFQKKLFYVGSLFFLCVALCMSVIFYVYTYNKSSKEIEKFYVQTNQTVATEIDYLLANMDRLTTQLVANETVQRMFMEAGEDTNQDVLYFDHNIEQKSLLQKECIALNTPLDNKGIINIYKSPNIFFTNNIGRENPQHIKAQLQDCYEFKEGKNEESAVIFTGPHEDYWKLSEDNTLFISILRPLVSTYSGRNTVGTIEMNENFNKIEEICRVSEQFKDMNTIILDSKTKKAIYPYGVYSQKEIEYYLKYKDSDGKSIEQIEAYDGQKMMLNVQKSEKSGWVIMAIQPANVYKQPLINMSVLVFSVLVVFVLGMILAIFYATNKLTTPIRDLKQAVKTVTLDNVDIHMDNSTNNEIESLKQVFSDILNKLRASANDLALSQATEYEAKIMALQAQINPHFLYNSLMAISAAGMENGNKKVEVMCNQLSALFRYAANECYDTTIRDEISNVRTYLEFMKWRYMDTVEYSINVDELLNQVEVPKLILQPVVENCFVYAFHSILPPLKIQVDARVQNNCWIIKVIDNGTGISMKDMNQLQELKSQVEEIILHKKFGGHLEVGGKALINIFARLYLIYGETAIFQIENMEKAGLCVILGGPLQRPKLLN